MDTDEEPARSWVSQHGTELSHLDTILAIVAPAAVTDGIRAGHDLDLDVDAGFHWALALLALNAIAAIDLPLAIRVVEKNSLSIARGLANPYMGECSAIPQFLGLLQNLSEDAFHQIVSQIDPVIAKEKWIERLRGRAVERRAITALLESAVTASGVLTDLADELRSRFPTSGNTS